VGAMDPVIDSVTKELVSANHILFRHQVVDAFGHVSVRHPGNPDTFLISSGKAPALVTQQDIVELDLDGRAVQGIAQSLYLERFIHAEIYRKRRDVMAVVHSHSPSVVPFSVVPSMPLRPIFHMAGFLHPPAPVFEIRDSAGDGSNLLVSTPELGRALAQSIGVRSVVLMRGHGSTVVGCNLRQAVFRAIYTEINARLQREALSLGTPVYLTPAEAAACVASVSTTIDRAWNLWLGRL
jgi:ribulose-5-phosphate 4-epimerase/fuculose-1-phosphate aldolase